MIERVLAFSVRHRWLVVLIALAAAASGLWSLTRCRSTRCPTSPTTRCRSIRVAPALSPVEVEKQVTFPIETALAGHPGPRIHALALAQRLLPGHGGLRGAHRHLLRAPAGRRAADRGAAVAAARRRAADGADLDRARRNLHVDGRAMRRRTGSAGAATASRAGSRDGTYLTPEGQRLRGDFERAAYLRTVQDWIIRPQLQERERRRRRRRDRRIRQAVPRRSPTRRS